MNQLSIFEIQADLCKALGNPVRLEIVHSLRQGSLKVSEIIQMTGYEQTTISRHLSVLRNAGILAAHGAGRDVVYQIANSKIVEMCDLVRQVLFEQSLQQSEMFKAWDKS